MNVFLSGAVMMASVVIGLFFFRFWRRTGDRLLGVFAVAFWLLALERWIMALVEIEREGRHLVYLVRLVAFALILLGVIDKNRARR